MVLKLCFIDPPGIHKGYNIGLAYLCSMVKHRDMDLQVFDFNNLFGNMCDRINEIRRYDIVGLSIKTFTLRKAVEIGRAVKHRKNILVAGGPHITLDGFNFLCENPFFDVAVRGEAEYVVRDLFDSADTLKDIEGILHKDSCGIVIQGRQVSSEVYSEESKLLNPPLIRDLDSLPFPSYEFFDSVKMKKGIENYPVITSRGCPYQCTFCCVGKVSGKKFRFRSPHNVISELILAKEKYNIQSFNIQDDDFTLDMKRAKEICQLLIDENLRLRGACSNGVRADRLDQELLDLMKESGFESITIGIESAMNAEFESLKKGEKLEEVINAVQMARNVGIKVVGCFIIGLPHSTIHSVRANIKFAKKLGLDSSYFNLLVPYPGTEIYNWAKENARFLADWKEGFFQGLNPKIVIETDEFRASERLRAYYEANTKLRNYFAFVKEDQDVLRNALRIVGAIIRYDAPGVFSHVSYLIRHLRRILNRIHQYY